MAALAHIPDRVNLSDAKVLLVCGQTEGELLAEMFSGFGARVARRYGSGVQAMQVLNESELNLVIVDAVLSDMGGDEFIASMRRSQQPPNRHAPVILVTSHATQTQILRGRDAGANFVICKPVTPEILMQRILWLIRSNKQFVTAPHYCGPDRRMRQLGPPPGMAGRRHDDLSADVGAATTPNLGQAEIDALFNPRPVYQ